MKIGGKKFITTYLKAALFSILIISASLYTYGGTFAALATTFTWTRASDIKTPTDSNYLGLASSADGMKLAFAGNGSGGNVYIYTSIDGGATWTARTGAGSRRWVGITSSADGMRLAALGYGENPDHSLGGGHIFTSTDGGATWTERATIGSNYYIWTALASSADGMKLIVAGSASALTADMPDLGTSPVYTSIDGGATWKKRPVDIVLGSLSNLASSADGTRLVITASQIHRAAYNYPNGVYFVVPNDYIYGYSDGAVFTSIDSGATWKKQTFVIPNPRINLTPYFVTSSADGLKLAIAPSTMSHIYTSTDGGATWADRTPPTDGPGGVANYWIAISSSADGTRLAAAAQPGYIYTSFDSGATWNSNPKFTGGNCQVENMGSAQSVIYSSDGSTIITANQDHHIYIGKEHSTNYLDWVGYYPPALTVTSPYPGQTFAAGSSFRIQGSVRYRMTTASAENVAAGWANHDGTQKGSQTLYSTSSSCSASGCPNYDNTSNFSLAGYATSSPAIVVPSTAGTYRFYVYATSTNSCETNAMSAYQDYVVSQAGQCGTRNTSPVTQFDKNHPVTGTSCSAGTIVNQTQVGSNYNWQCAGVNGGATSATCSYVYNDPVDGVCGPDNGVPTKTAPSGLCYVGTSTSPTMSSSSYAWSCLGSNYGATASCSAPISKISVSSFKLISSLANSSANQCTAEWSVSTTGTSSISCILNGNSVPSFSAGYAVPAGVVTLTCTQGSASYTKSLKCSRNPGYKEI